MTVVRIQIVLGGYVVWSGKQPVITSVHVMTGAARWPVAAHRAHRADDRLAHAPAARRCARNRGDGMSDVLALPRPAGFASVTATTSSCRSRAS